MNRIPDMRLIPDCGGLISQVAFSVPGAFFQYSQAGWSQPLVPIGNLLKALPQETEALVLLDRGTQPEAESWLNTLDLKCRLTLLLVDDEASAIPGPWIQDGFHVRAAAEFHASVTDILRPPEVRTGDLLAAFLKVPAHDLHVDLPGGNQLVGPDFRLVGQSSTAGAGLPGGIDERERLFDQLQLFDPRPVRIFGYRRDDLLPNRADHRSLDEPRPAVIDAEYLLKNVHQFGFHVDQFVSVTGLTRNGRPLLLVGEPAPADGSQSQVIENARRNLDASVLHLKRQGFEVIRNPVPFVVTPDSGKRLPRLYNNVMLENGIRTNRRRPMVWLAHFGDVEPLGDYDRANRELWEQLNFEVVPIYGWSYLASRNGAIRCASKVLKRLESL